MRKWNFQRLIYSWKRWVSELIESVKIRLKIHKNPIFTDLCAAKSAIPHMKLDDLNDDCLAHIFQMLDIHDLFNIACASQRFENVLPLFNRKFVYNVINVNAPNLKHFLQTVGQHIRTLKVSIGENIRSSAEVIEFFECVQKHCANVKHLALKKWTRLNFNRCSELLQRLESLELDECEYTELNEWLNRRFVIKPWIAQPGLCSLQLALQKSCGLSDLTSLTSLKLHRCKGFGPNNLREFLEQNDRLTDLSLFALKDFKNVDETYFDGVAKYCQNIVSISIDVNTTSNIQFISGLPKLRSLQLLDYSVFNERIVDRLIRRLCENETIEVLDLYHCNLGQNTYRVISQFKKLHTLKLCKNFWVTDQHLQSLNLMHSLKTACFFDNLTLTDDSVISLVRMAPQLTQLDCSWCYQITDRAINYIKDLLHHERHRPNLEIVVGGRTKIDNRILSVS